MLYRDAPHPRWTFEPDGITFVDYPFYPASVHPTGHLEAGRIDDVDLGAWPPAVRVGNELLMVSAGYRDDLRALAERHGIPLAGRADSNWGGILEPALDTEFGEDSQQHTYDHLGQRGLNRAEVDDLRRRFVPALMAYNFCLPVWDWTHLGLFDLLEAVHPDARYPAHQPPTYGNHDTYPDIYWEAMRVALLEVVPTMT
jgi:hypothetical protein